MPAAAPAATPPSPPPPSPTTPSICRQIRRSSFTPARLHQPPSTPPSLTFTPFHATPPSCRLYNFSLIRFSSSFTPSEVPLCASRHNRRIMSYIIHQPRYYVADATLMLMPRCQRRHATLRRHYYATPLPLMPRRRCASLLDAACLPLLPEYNNTARHITLHHTVRRRHATMPRLPLLIALITLMPPPLMPFRCRHFAYRYRHFASL